MHLFALSLFGQVCQAQEADTWPPDSLDYAGYKFSFSPDSCSYLPLYIELENWFGTRYRYAGGTGAGIDCSGLVKALYKNVYGIPLQGGSLSLFQSCKRIDPKDLSESDLVFFKTRKNRVSHVGLYLRDGYFVHSTRGNGVIVSHMDEAYYKQRFAGSGRVK